MIGQALAKGYGVALSKVEDGRSWIFFFEPQRPNRRNVPLFEIELGQRVLQHLTPTLWGREAE